MWKKLESKELSNRTHYISYFNEMTELRNGFIYIQELILQAHNFRMYMDYLTLRNNKVKVFSVKTDAYTILKTDLNKAMELLRFEKGIGNWRCSKEGDLINIPKKHV